MLPCPWKQATAATAPVHSELHRMHGYTYAPKKHINDVSTYSSLDIGGPAAAVVVRKNQRGKCKKTRYGASSLINVVQL